MNQKKEKTVGQKVEEAVGRGIPAPKVMQIMVVDFLKELAAGKPMVTITDGQTTFQCLMNDPSNQQPKRP